LGQKQAAYNSTGAIVAYYDTIDSPAPSGATVINIADDQWQAAISAQGYTVVNGTLTPPAPPSAAALLDAARAAQKAAIDAAYANAVQQSVTFKTAAGVTQTFQADSDSQTILSQATQGYQIAGGVPSNFYWKAADNTLVAFVLADLEGLYVTMLSQGWVAFQKRAALKAQIDAAATVTTVESISWEAA
jgi:hypothetical protein